MNEPKTFKLGFITSRGEERVLNKGPYNPESACSKCGGDNVVSNYKDHSREYDAHGKWIDIPDWILRRCERCGYLWGEECVDRNRDILSTEERESYEKELTVWDEKLKPLVDANRESENITAEDLKIVINTRPDEP